MPVVTSDAWCFAFLDSIRNRGVTSMALAIPRLRRERHLSRSEATAMLARWAEYYGAAHDEAPLFGREVRLPRPWGERAADASKTLGRIASYIARAGQELTAALKSTVLRHSSHPL
jgi:hypothetical protein